MCLLSVGKNVCMEMPPIDDKTWMTFGKILPDQKLSCKAVISFSAGPKSHIISFQIFLHISKTVVFMHQMILAI